MWAVDNPVCCKTGQSRFNDVTFLMLVGVSVKDSIDAGCGDSCSQDSLSLWAR
jgi:hypothetical protein